MSVRRLFFYPAILLAATSSLRAQAGYANFEGAQTSPIRLSPDGSRLFAVNTANATLSVFSLSSPATPKLIAEIPVGLEPVSVNPRTNDEAWVVNQLSNSVSIVSVAKKIVTDTIAVAIEPMDVVFANNTAWVSASRSNAVALFDIATHAARGRIPIFGGNPRALAVSPDGTMVYALCALSGNGTTLVPVGLAPPQSPQPPNLPPPPAVGLIVKWNDPNWSSVIHYTMPDNDVAVLSTSSFSVTGYYSGAGTINLGMGVNPVTGDLYVANTEARNLTHFQTNLKGHWVDNRITKITVATGQVTPIDLNPGINYANPPGPAALALAIAQPAAVSFDPGGNFFYVASFGTDRVAAVDKNGNVLARVEIAAPGGAGSNVDPKNKKGPRGLALHATAQVLYVQNRISNTISLVNTANGTLLGEIPVGADPTPAVIRQGRGFLYDAKLSGYGTGSCASCHVDGDMDHLAWDLGDPTGSMVTIPTGTGGTVQIHPMKGPMTTQTLRGLANLSPYHWRGEKQNFAAFNEAFDGLMAGTPLSAADMTAYTNFVNTILFFPNPYQNLDRTYPASLGGGNAQNGYNVFTTQFLMIPQPGACNTCHTANPGPGSNRVINPPHSTSGGSDQPLKVPQLRNMYQKAFFTKQLGVTIDGFGFNHEGDVATMHEFLASPNFAKYSAAQKTDMAAYQFAFDTGTAPAVGYTRTATPSNIGSASLLSDWTTLEQQATAGNIDLGVTGTVNGKVATLLYVPGLGSYVGAPGVFTKAQLSSLVAAGDTLSVMGVYPGTGTTVFAAAAR